MLNADGGSVLEHVLPNPDFRLLQPSIGRGQHPYASVPFLRQDLTDDQLALIDVIELDVPVTAPDQTYSAFLDQDETVSELKEAGLKLSVDEWGSEAVRIRVSEAGGIAPGTLPRLMGYPVDETGEPVPQFGLRLSHSLFESVLDSMDEPRPGRKALTTALMGSLATMPPHEKNGDIIFEFTGTASQPVERLKFHYYSTRTETMTFAAPSIRAMRDDSEAGGAQAL